MICDMSCAHKRARRRRKRRDNEVIPVIYEKALKASNYAGYRGIDERVMRPVKGYWVIDVFIKVFPEVCEDAEAV